MSFRISQDAAAAVSGSPSFRAAWARRAVLCGIGALLLCWQPAPASAATIQSTTAGGYWSSAATWVGGVKPTATDIARISGPVAITSGTPTVAGLIVDASASLVGGTSSSATLIVHGNVDNQGTISNYSPTKTLIIKADGDVLNSGTLANSTFYFETDGSRTIDGTFPVSVVMSGSFDLSGHPVFSGAWTHYSTGAETRIGSGASVTTASPSLQDITAPGGGTLYINGADQSDYDITAATIHLGGTGIKRIIRNNIYGDLIVEAGVTVQDYASSWGEVTVHGNLTNHGTIRNEPGSGSGYSLTVNVTGDITNLGSFLNNRVNAFWEAVTGAASYQFAITNDLNNWPAPATYTVPTKVDITNKLNSTWYWRTRAQVNGQWPDWKLSPVQVINRNTAPTITLHGPDPLQLLTGEDYAEPGPSPSATAWDAEEGDLTGSIVVDSSEVTNHAGVPGTYQVSYTVEDRWGQQAQPKYRTVEVATLAAPTDLVQLNSYDATITPGQVVGASLPDRQLKFQATVTDPFQRNVCLVVGLQRLDPEPQEVILLPASTPVAPGLYGAPASVTMALDPPLAPGNYRWVAATREAGHCEDTDGVHESPFAESNVSGEGVTDFQVVGFEPEYHGFKFPNSVLDFGNLTPEQIDTRIYEVFKTAFDLSDLTRFPSEAAKQAVSAALFPADNFGHQDGFCFGMARAALLRYASEPFLKHYFSSEEDTDDFWDALAVTEPGDVLPRALANLENNDFKVYPTQTASPWDGVSLGDEPVLDMIIRMQMWDKLHYGENELYWIPKEVLDFLKQSEPDRKPFGSYAISIQLQSLQNAGHFVIPYKVTADNKVYVYDPNESDNPDKFIHFYQEDPQDPDSWKWEYYFLQDNLLVRNEGVAIILSDFALLTENAPLPTPPPTPTPNPTPTP